MTGSQLPDLLPAVKAWIVALGALPGGIYYNLPRTPSGIFGRLTRTGGGPEADSEVPVSSIICTVEIWGMANRDYEAVRTAAGQIEQAVHDVNGPSYMGADTGVVMLAANVLTGYDSPDPDTGFPRYILSLRITGRRSA